MKSRKNCTLILFLLIGTQKLHWKSAGINKESNSTVDHCVHCLVAGTNFFSKSGHWGVSSTPFGFPFRLPVRVANWTRTELTSSKSCWTDHFTNISNCFDKLCYLKEKCTFCSYLFWGTPNGNWTDQFTCQLRYCSSCKLN